MECLERFAQKAEELKSDQKFKNQVARDTVAFLILETMEQRGISQEDLAKGLGTSKGNITQLLRGNRNFSLDLLNQIASVLNRELNISFSFPTTNE